MAVFLILLSFVFVFFSLATFSLSRSPLKEIEALLCVLIGVILLVGSAIVRELKPVRKNAQRLMEQYTNEEAEDEEEEEEETNTREEEDDEERTFSRKKCPSCGRRNVASATRCDCGWSLAVN